MSEPKSKAMLLSDAFGYLFAGEVLLLQRIARELPAGSIVVNLGSGTGTSSLAVIEANPDVVLYTVDISPGGPLGGLENEWNAFQNAGIPFKHQQILGDAIEVGRGWNKGKITLLIVDDDHSYDHVLEEVKVWKKHVDTGSLVLFHDYESANWADVVRVVDETMSEEEFVERVDTYALYRIR